MKMIFRHASPTFNSIENVFNTLLLYLKVEKVALPYPSQGLFLRLKNIRYLAKQKSSIIHITGHDHYLLWWPFKNTILTIHDIEAYKRKNGWKRWFFKKLWFDIPIRNARIVTTISEFSKKEILSLGDYKTPIHVIQNPLTLPLEYQPKTFNSEKPRILHLGTKTNKNILRLIEALEGIPSELIIIGALNSELEAALNQNKITYQVLTALSNDAVMEEYKTCDLLSFVSTYEGFGLPILEAQAIGRPVLSSNVSSMPEVAGEGALLVNPFSVEEIRKGVLKIIQDEALRNDLIQKGLENVGRFDARKIAEEYKVLYEELDN